MDTHSMEKADVETQCSNSERSYKGVLKTKILGICLIVFFGIASIITILAFFITDSSGTFPISTLKLFLATIINLAFVIGGIGVLKICRWGLWVTVSLCGVSIVNILWEIATTLTPETATKELELVVYVVAGFYLAIAFLLTTDSSRKLFREMYTARQREDSKIADNQSVKTITDSNIRGLGKGGL